MIETFIEAALVSPPRRLTKPVAAPLDNEREGVYGCRCEFDFAVFVTVKVPELVGGEGCWGLPITAD